MNGGEKRTSISLQPQILRIKMVAQSGGKMCEWWGLTMGLGSVATGFAFKDVFENFLARIIILFRREMRIGDHIQCLGIEGEVTHVAIRESHISRTDGQLVIVPNLMLFKTLILSAPASRDDAVGAPFVAQTWRPRPIGELGRLFCGQAAIP